MSDPNAQAKMASVEEATRLLLNAVGHGDRPGTDDTPRRVAKMWIQELCTGTGVDLIEIINSAIFEDHVEDPHEDPGMVIVKDIPFYSVCEHHLIPFHGVANVGYISRGRVVGLSKIARVVDMAARQPQVQERITTQVANAIQDSHLDPEGCGVVIEAEHLCMSMRGIQKPGSTTVTSTMTGSFISEHNPEVRAEFLSLIGKK